MRFRLVASVLAMAVSTSVYASEGLIYGAVYECDAKSINQGMTQACASQFPKMAKRANDAYQAWLVHNSKKADLSAIACKQEMHAWEAVHSASEVDAMRRKMDDLKMEMRASFQSSLLTEGEAVCDSALRQLETGSSGVEIR